MTNRSAHHGLLAGAHAPARDDARELDLRGLKCPLPALKVRKALRTMPAGALLTALCDDPLAVIDVPNMVREDGHLLVEASGGSAPTFVIRKVAASPDER